MKMTIERAREILGPDADGISDQQMDDLLARYSVLVEIVIETAEAQVGERKAS